MWARIPFRFQAPPRTGTLFLDPASDPGQTVNGCVWHPRTRTVRTNCSFPRECSSCRSTPSPRGGISTRKLNPGLRVRLSFDFHAATNIRYNSVKRNSHKALLPYGNKLKGLGRYINQDLEGYISLYTATPHGQINRGHTSLGLPPQMATAGKGTPATGCCPK